MGKGGPNHGEWCNQINQSQALVRHSLQTMLKRFADIRWDPSTFLKGHQVIMAPCPWDDSTKITMFSKFHFNGEDKSAMVDRRISHMTMLSVDQNRIIDIIAQETELGAAALVDHMLEQMGTSYDKERDRFYKNATARMQQTMATPPTVIVPPSMEHELNAWMAKLNSPTTDYTSFGMSKVVADPNMPKDQFAFVSDGKVVGVAKNVGVEKLEEEPENLSTMVKRRAKDAPWK